MDLEESLIDKLLANGGGRKFFVSALLLLDPKDLKACRQVCSSWDKFIVDEVWGSKACKAKLAKKLLHRWMNDEAENIGSPESQVGTARDNVVSLFFDDTHVFCGQRNHMVGVYSLANGEWIRDLKPTDPMPPRLANEYCHGFPPDAPLVSGGKQIVAAAIWGCVVTVWSCRGEMEELHCLDLGDNHCYLNTGEIRVVDQTSLGSKVVILAHNKHNPDMASLSLIWRGEHGWQDKILARFHTGLTPYYFSILAANGDWTALAWDVKSKSDPGVRVALWHGEDKMPDVVLHGPSGPRVTGIALEPPFIIFSLKGDPSARHREGCSWISVYKMDTDNLGDNSSTKVELVKAIPIDGFNCTEMSQVNRLLSNDLVLCFVQNQEEDMDNIVHVFDKARLLNEDIAAEDIRSRQIELPYWFFAVNINFRSLLCATDGWIWVDWVDGEEDKWEWFENHSEKGEIFIKDFWIDKKQLGADKEG